MSGGVGDAVERFTERPDSFYSLVAGLYVALLAAPAAVWVIGTLVSGAAAVVYVSLLAAVAILTGAVAWYVSRLRGIAERAGASRRSLALLAIPIALVVGYFVAGTIFGAGWAGGVSLIGAFLSLGGSILGVALIVMSRTRYTAALVDSEPTAAAWSAGWPSPRRRQVILGSFAAIAVGFGVTAVSIAWNVSEVFYLGQAIAMVGVVVISLGQERTYRATPAGLERADPAARRLHDWDAFTTYDVTDDSVVVSWRARWRPSIRMSLAALDDPDAVVDALDEYLPRA